MSLLWQPHRQIARFDRRPTGAALDDLRDRVAVVRERARVASWLRDRTFLIVTPLGAATTAELEFRLARRSWSVTARVAWPDWAKTSAALYVWQLAGERLCRGLAYQALWHRLFPGAAAELWVLDSRVRHRDLAAAKAELRRGLPHLHPRLILPDLAFSAKLHPFHVPDRWELDVAARVASHMARPEVSGIPRARSAIFGVEYGSASGERKNDVRESAISYRRGRRSDRDDRHRAGRSPRPGRDAPRIAAPRGLRDR